MSPVRWEESPDDFYERGLTREDVEADDRAAEEMMGPPEPDYDPECDPWNVDPVVLCAMGYSPPQAMWDAWDAKHGDGIEQALNETGIHPVSGETA